MIQSLKGFPLLASLFILLSYSAFSSDELRSHAVVKNDGTTAHYKFLPVHFDPAQSSKVLNRFQNLKLQAKATPTQYSISHDLLPFVRDQGQRGTCAYFATLGLLETYYMAEDPVNEKINLSVECLVNVRNWMYDQFTSYNDDDKPEVRPDPNGDLPYSIIRTIVRNGVPASRKYSAKLKCSYNGYNTNGGSIPLETYQTAFTTVPKPSIAYGKDLPFEENIAPTFEDVKFLISKNIPVEVGVVVYNSYLNGSSWIFNPATDTEENIAGGHAIQLTGYRVVNGKTLFEFKNSWSDTWGNMGFGLIDDVAIQKSWEYDPAFDFAVSVHN